MNPAVTKVLAPPNNEIVLEDDNHSSNSIANGSSEDSLDDVSDDSEQLQQETIAAALDSNDAYDFNAMETDDMPTVTSSKRKLEVIQTSPLFL